MPTYQLVAYNWHDKIGKEVSHVTQSNINHVSIRINPITGLSRELYVSPKPTDTYVLSKAVERMNGAPVWASQHYNIYHHQVEWIKERAADWKRRQPGNVLSCYLYHYIGRHIKCQTPSTCTKLCNEVLNYLGVPVTETFYPNRLVADYLKEVY